MGFALAIALSFIAFGAFLTWAMDGVAWGSDGDMIGTFLMVVGGAGVVALTILFASRAAARGGGTEREPIDDPDDLTARWSRR